MCRVNVWNYMLQLEFIKVREEEDWFCCGGDRLAAAAASCVGGDEEKEIAGQILFVIDRAASIRIVSP